MFNPLTAAKSELAVLLRQKAEIEAKIAAVEETVGILEPLYSVDEAADGELFESVQALVKADLGITEQIRRIMEHHGLDRPLWPTQVRDLLLHAGFDAKGRSNLMAEVHTVLKRLVESGEAEVGPDENGLTVYWSTGVRRVGDALTEVLSKSGYRPGRVRRHRTVARKATENEAPQKPT